MATSARPSWRACATCCSNRFNSRIDPMDRSLIRQGVLDALLAIAPEVDAAALRDTQPLREQVDLDSMDWLNVLLGLHQRFAVDIPESDYARLGTLAQIVDYLAQRVR
jgi:acyl carrier protein